MDVALGALSLLKVLVGVEVWEVAVLEGVVGVVLVEVVQVVGLGVVLGLAHALIHAIVPQPKAEG